MQRYFAIIEDPRHQGYVKHKLSDILLIVMCAVLCGMDQLCDVMAYAQNKADFFRTNFGIEQIPSKPTMSRVLSVIDGQKIAETIFAILQETLGTQGDVIAVDGKAIRSTSVAGKPHSALQIITVYLTGNGVVLGQEKIHEKTNEIPVFQKMLSYLNITGKTITADAMHCQRETCAKITERGGDYVLGLKENQKSLHDDVELYFADASSNDELEQFVMVEKNGGRVEKRVCKKIKSAKWLQERHEWPGLVTAFCIERTVSTKKKTTKETSYYITSTDESAEKLLCIVREHWMIESMHWMLDAVFSEDESRFSSDNAHLCMNAFRKVALGLQKNYIATVKKKCSVKRHLIDCLLNEQLLLKVIASAK